jgi:hypothetical protein
MEPGENAPLAPAKIIRMFQHAIFIRYITGEIQCLINHRIDQCYLYKGLPPVCQENPSTAQCKAVTGRQKTEKRHGFAQWKPFLGLACKNDFQPFPQMPSFLFVSTLFIVYLCPHPFIYRFLGEGKVKAVGVMVAFYKRCQDKAKEDKPKAK